MKVDDILDVGDVLDIIWKMYHWLPLIYIGTFSNHSLVEFPSGILSLLDIYHHSSAFESNLYLIIGNTEFIAKLDQIQN